MSKPRQSTIVHRLLAPITIWMILTLAVAYQLSMIAGSTLQNSAFFSSCLRQLDLSSVLSTTASGWLPGGSSATPLEEWLGSYLSSLLEEAIDPDWVEDTTHAVSQQLAAYFMGEGDQLVLLLRLEPLKINLTQLVTERFRVEWADWFSDLFIRTLPDHLQTDDLAMSFPVLQQVRSLSVLLNTELLGWALLLTVLLSLICLFTYGPRAILFLILPVAVAGWGVLLVLPFINSNAHLTLGRAELGDTVQVRYLLFLLKDTLMLTARHIALQTAVMGSIGCIAGVIIVGLYSHLSGRQDQ